MIFANYGGGRYWFFKHESWNGEQPAFIFNCSPLTLYFYDDDDFESCVYLFLQA